MGEEPTQLRGGGVKQKGLRTHRWELLKKKRKRQLFFFFHHRQSEAPNVASISRILPLHLSSVSCDLPVLSSSGHEPCLQCGENEFKTRGLQDSPPTSSTSGLLWATSKRHFPPICSQLHQLSAHVQLHGKQKHEVTFDGGQACPTLRQLALAGSKQVWSCDVMALGSEMFLCKPGSGLQMICMFTLVNGAILGDPSAYIFPWAKEGMCRQEWALAKLLETWVQILLGGGEELYPYSKREDAIESSLKLILKKSRVRELANGFH